MTTAAHWLAIQFDDEGKVIDVAPFGGYQRASIFALSNGRAKDGWTVRQVAEGETAAASFDSELPVVEPRKVTKTKAPDPVEAKPAKKAAAPRTRS